MGSSSKMAYDDINWPFLRKENSWFKTCSIPNYPMDMSMLQSILPRWEKDTQNFKRPVIKLLEMHNLPLEWHEIAAAHLYSSRALYRYKEHPMWPRIYEVSPWQTNSRSHRQCSLITCRCIAELIFLYNNCLTWYDKRLSNWILENHKESNKRQGLGFYLHD